MAKLTNNNLIVIAEDSLTQAELLKYTLENAGYRVLHGINGKEAFSLIKKEKPILLITDILMPVMDGYELCEKVKTDADLENIPVILLTKLSDPSDIIDGLESKADNFIVKPYNDKVLLSCVRRIILNQELREDQLSELGLDILFAGKKHRITSNRLQILDLLLSLFENFSQKNIEITEVNKKLDTAHSELKKINLQLENRVEERTRQLSHLNGILRAIRNVNQLIITENNPNHLIQRACELLTEDRGYESAWIALYGKDEKFVSFAESGIGDDLIPMKKLLKEGKLVECCRRALKKSGVIVIEDPGFVCKGCPLLGKNADCRKLSIRLKHKKKLYGFLIVSLITEFPTDNEEQSLFTEVAGDIAFALHDIELEKEHKKARIALEKKSHNLNEKVKELNCLYGIDEITTLPSITLEEVFRETVDITRKSWQFPGITGVKITHDKDIFETGNFEKTKWMLETDLVVDNKVTGKIEVCYLEKKPDSYQGPFLEEEIHLLQGIANSLVKYIKRQEIQNELIKAKEKVEESDRLKSSFLSNMSHEIRTPLNVIVGFSEMFGNDDIPDEEKRRFIPIIQENTNQLLHLIDDILDLAKMESDQLKIFIKKFRVGQVLENLVEVYNNQKTKIGKNEIDIRLKAEKQIEELSMHTDPVRLQQVISNLIGNSLKFTETGYIEIGCSVQTKKDQKNDKFIQFYVKDTGIGISEKEQKIIFDRFTKIEDDKTKLYRGTGLGLAISKKLVNILGGEMWVESTPGEGSTFYFTIPTGKVEMPKTMTGPAKKVQETFGSDNWADKSILVAEDEESNFRLIEIILQKTKANITWVTNGEDAVKACKSKSFDLVIMDIKMPVMDGFTATKEIKKFKEELPVIAVTAYAREEEQEEARLAGCDDIVVKPVNIEKLLTTLSKYI